MPLPIESAVYPFEGLLPDLESPPIAARRALDQAGLRLAIEGWRALSLEDRQQLTIAGMADRIDADVVSNLLQDASPSPQRIAPVPDPDPSTPPEALASALDPSRVIDPKRWARLRAVDRYALAHTYRRAVARSAFSILSEAYDALLGASSAPASYPPAGYYSSVASDAETPRAAARPSRPPITTPEPALSNHLNQAGEVHMVNVARKPATERRAIARGSVRMRADTLARLASRDAPKGEVLATARIAGVMAAKRTPEIIPLCHAVAVTHIEILIEIDAPASAVHVSAVVDAYDRTGCEMEAMVAVSAACLTIYDMLKGIDRDMVISEVKLMEKSGGRSGHYHRHEADR
ncbi:Molybdenum cofactor biosynthesis protein MoaC [Minicystis rosea]|nr:Molybdenum cofactor biosynthesis protein MoaC [Minicystis rosea]